MPGSPYPVEGKCQARLTKRANELGVDMRYCTQPAGAGTVHLGLGCCYKHGGRLPPHIVKWERYKVNQEIEAKVLSLSERLGKPPPLGDPAVELLMLAAEVKEYKNIIQQSMDEIQGELATTDRAGVERARAIVDKFAEALVLCRDTLVAIEKLGLAKRRIQLESDQASLIADIVAGVLQSVDLSLSDEQIDIGRSLAMSKLIEVSPALLPRDFVGIPNEEILDAEIVDE
jgi:hypothetical protein